MIHKSPEPRIIDVDGWVLGSLPATVAVMPSIRDWQTKPLSQKSDWFAWAVVTFQVYTGIHPYKGTLAGYTRAETERRMKDSASVFSPGVRLNAAVRDFTCVPGPLLNWYEATFQKNERTAPPSPFDTGITTPQPALILRAVTTGATGALIYEKLLDIPGDPVIRTFPCGVALLRSLHLIEIATKRAIVKATSAQCEVIRAGSGWLLGQVAGGTASFVYVRDDRTSEPQPFTARAHRLFAFKYVCLLSATLR